MMTGIRIPFNRLCLTGREYDYIRQAVESGHVSGNGLFSVRLLRLPFYTQLTESDQARVIETVREFHV